MTASSFAIMREPGPAARARAVRVAREYGVASILRPRRIDTVQAGSAKAALETFLLRHYSDHGQYVEHRYQWHGPTGARWRDDDRDAHAPGRVWRLAVTLANGASIHEVFYLAWKEDAR